MAAAKFTARKGNEITGADGRDRTGKEFPPRDFKSLASTNSATSAAALWLSRDRRDGKKWLEHVLAEASTAPPKPQPLGFNPHLLIVPRPILRYIFT